MSPDQLARPIRVEVGPVRVADDTFLDAGVSLAGRAAPVATPESEAFWRGCREGELRLLGCRRCGHLTHYPVGGCSACGEPDLAPEAVPATGVIHTFTVCYLSFGPGLEPPYVVAMVELDAQPGLRLITNVVNCEISRIRIGMRVRGLFTKDEPPLLFFEPAPDGFS